MLKGKDRPASADNVMMRPKSPLEAKKDRHSTTAGRGGQMQEDHMRSSTRMFRKSENSPSPTRKSRHNSPDRASSRQRGGGGEEQQQQDGKHNANAHGTTIVMSGKGVEVKTSD